MALKPHPLSFFLICLILSVSIIYYLDIISLCWREVMIGQSFLHVLLTISLPGTVCRVRPEAMHPPGCGKLGCIQETEASSGHCAFGLNGYVMWLWLHWCSASAHMLAALLWAGCRWSIQQLGQLTLNTLHCTWQLGNALNQTSNSSSWEFVIDFDRLIIVLQQHLTIGFYSI